MKKLTAFLLAVLIAISTNTGAEENRKQYQNRENFLLNVLQISDDQKEEFVSIMREQHEKKRTIRGEFKAPRKEEHEARKSLRRETISRLETVLSESQIKAFVELNEKRRSKKQGFENRK